MGFADHYFGKPIASLDFAADVEPFIRRELPEGQGLEYKSSSGSPISGHGDVISAFLNSGGGLLIIGTPQEVEMTLDGGRKARVCRGSFTPLAEISKDDVHRSLLSKVTPIPSSVLVNPVRCNGGCVIVVDVESSNYPPHQHDGTYWIRLDGETRRAPHALVESLFLQRRGPSLECRLEVLWSRLTDGGRTNDFRDQWNLRLRLTLVNNSRNIAEFCAVDVKSEVFTKPVNDGLQPADPQPGDFTFPVAVDEEGRSLQRYRLRADVLHAHEWKALEGELHYSRSMDWRGPRTFTMVVDLQAKDMLRRRYKFVVPVGMGLSRQMVEPVGIQTIDALP
jgi:hypothetical protein